MKYVHLDLDLMQLIKHAKRIFVAIQTVMIVVYLVPMFALFVVMGLNWTKSKIYAQTVQQMAIIGVKTNKLTSV